LWYTVAPRDPATLGSAAIVLACVGLAAGWLPSRHAVRVADSVAALRSE
jgi:hypothetical protein